MKYNGHIVNRICRIISREPVTVAQICSRVGISEPCYYYWQRTKPAFAERIQEARLKYDEFVLVECKRSLRKLIEGYFKTEEKIERFPREDGSERIIITTIIRYMPAKLRAIIMVLQQKDPDNWNVKNSKKVTGKDGKKLKIGDLWNGFKAEIIQNMTGNAQK